MILSFDDQPAFVLGPHTFLDWDANNECRTIVHRGASSEITLGDTLFGSGVLELGRNRSLVLFPHDLREFYDWGGVVLPATMNDDSTSSNSDIVLGVAIGGGVLILAIIIGLVVRAKRKQRIQRDRYSVTRPMVANPSISDAASEPSDHVRV
jgi:hypothetical protein